MDLWREQHCVSYSIIKYDKEKEKEIEERVYEETLLCSLPLNKIDFCREHYYVSQQKYKKEKYT